MRTTTWLKVYACKCEYSNYYSFRGILSKLAILNFNLFTRTHTYVFLFLARLASLLAFI